jgi:hypothetical protein
MRVERAPHHDRHIHCTTMARRAPTNRGASMPAPDASGTPDRWRAVEPDHQLPPARPGRRYDNADLEPGLIPLLRSLADDTATLLRQEVELAKTEVKHTARRLAVDSAWIATGGAIAAVGALCLVLAMALGLGALLGSYWLGTLITGVFLLLVGGGFLFKGVRDLGRQPLAPKQTAESLREDARWAQEQARDFKQRLSQE